MLMSHLALHRTNLIAADHFWATEAEMALTDIVKQLSFLYTDKATARSGHRYLAIFMAHNL